jgi:hypothetical protein
VAIAPQVLLQPRRQTAVPFCRTGRQNPAIAQIVMSDQVVVVSNENADTNVSARVTHAVARVWPSSLSFTPRICQGDRGGYQNA